MDGHNNVHIHTPRWAPGYTLLLLCAITLSPCRVAASGVQAEPTQAQLQGIVQSLERYAVAEMQAARVPGLAMAVVQSDRVIYARGFGVRKQGRPGAVDENTLFEIGSLTKSFTATLMAMLVDDGKLSWTDPMVQHMADFRMKTPWVTREMQIADILCHRSGMPGYQLDAMELLGFQRPDIVKAVRWVVPVSSFRSAYAYSNTLYLAAGQLIEATRGHSWEEELSAKLLQPLDMRASTGDPDAVMPGNVASGHMILSDGSLWPIPANWRYGYALKTAGPAGGIYSNVVDMAQWLRFQLANGGVDGKQLVSTDNLAVTRAPRTLIASDPSGSSQSYAMGWIYAALAPQPLLWHNGSTGGMHSAAGLIPGSNVGVVILANATSAVPEKVLGEFYALYFQPWSAANSDGATVSSLATPLSDALSASVAQDVQHPRIAPMSAAQLERLADADVSPAADQREFNRYAGAYWNPAYGRFTVEIQNQRLVMIMGPAHIAAPMVHFRGNVFIATVPDYPELQLPVQFLVDRTGLVTGLLVPPLGDVNGGRFKRQS